MGQGHLDGSADQPSEPWPRCSSAVATARQQGGEIVCGGSRLDRPGFFVEPALVKASPAMPIVAEETFAPILYVMRYRTLDEAIAHSERVSSRD